MSRTEASENSEERLRQNSDEKHGSQRVCGRGFREPVWSHQHVGLFHKSVRERARRKHARRVRTLCPVSCRTRPITYVSHASCMSAHGIGGGRSRKPVSRWNRPHGSSFLVLARAEPWSLGPPFALCLIRK